ncbi:MAG: zinc finger domain-containing protein [Polyangiales bacterium]
MLAECRNCGAPLDVPSGARNAKCGYCGAPNRVRQMRTLSQERPPDWQPPPVWTPPPQATAQSVPLNYSQTQTSGNKAGCVIGIAVAAMSLIGVVPALLATGALSKIGIGGWDGTEPFRCGGNDSVTIEDVNADLGDLTAITVGGNCELRIVGSEIRAWQGIDAGGNRSVIIENSKIFAKGTGIAADGNKRIELVNSEVVAEGGPAVDAQGIAKVTISGGRVEGTPTAVRTESLASSDVRGADVVDAAGGEGGGSTAAGR